MILTHYSSRLSDRPNRTFLTITEHNPSQQHEIAKRLSKEVGRALRRFDEKSFDDYLLRRTQTEEWLYESFLELGGVPEVAHPYYFIVGENEQLRRDFGNDARVFQIDTKDILSCHISFTLGDSMGVFSSSACKIVYTLEQIEERISEEGYIKIQMEGLPLYHQYIEAQLWSKKYLLDTMIIRNYQYFRKLHPDFHDSLHLTYSILITLDMRLLIISNYQKEIKMGVLLDTSNEVLWKPLLEATAQTIVGAVGGYALKKSQVNFLRRTHLKVQWIYGKEESIMAE